MIHGFRELTLGGVLVAPFVPYAAAALGLTALLRPALRRAPVERAFANPPLAWLCAYALILAALFVLV